MPGVKGFVVSGFFGRAPMSMLGLGIILLISAFTGSYTMAGAVAGTVSVALAVAAPLTGRLADRFGQGRILVPLVLTHAAALIALMLCVRSGAPHWTLYVTGTVTGLTAVSLGSMVRARWTHLLGGSPKLHIAFSFESVADEVIFVAGPALVTALATLINPYAGLIVALASTLLGTLFFAAQRGTEPPVRPAGRHSRSPVTVPGIALLCGVFLAMGAVFGSVDIITVGFAEEHGSKGMSGGLLAAFSAGSMVSGLWYGARSWKLTLRGRFVRALLFFAVGLTPIVLIGNLPLMALALFVAGMAISPTLITGYSMIERLAPPHLLTEGMAWLSTSVGFGVALGAWAGGRMTDAFGASDAYAISLGSALLAVLIGLAGSGLLRASEAPSTA
ncbi:MFS transporter [Spongiactinospora sp. TRM90649]|nr:MFS transporter [Spongiactinospora sp. TRM90649]